MDPRKLLTMRSISRWSVSIDVSCVDEWCDDSVEQVTLTESVRVCCGGGAAVNACEPRSLGAQGMTGLGKHSQGALSCWRR